VCGFPAGFDNTGNGTNSVSEAKIAFVLSFFFCESYKKDVAEKKSAVGEFVDLC